ncbi:MAG: hypothetical protein ABIK68_23570 [bacterium]
MPDTIVIPGTLFKYSSSQACLEFPFYHFLFIQQGLARGRKFRVYANRSTCRNLSEMIRVTLIGPSVDEMLKAEKKLKIPEHLDHEKVAQISKEIQFLAPKDKNGKPYQLEEMIEFIPFETGDKTVVYEAYQDHPEMTVERTGHNHFTVQCSNSFDCTIQIDQPQSPVYPIKPPKVSKSELASKTVFSVQCLGASEGFDPTQPANGFLLHINQKWYLWDCPAFLRKHLQSIGITFEDVDGIFISHVHEDHLDIMETISDKKRTKIYSSPEIFHCMLLKLKAILDCSYSEAQARYDFQPIYANQPFELSGATFEVFYSSHAIPALGLRLSVDGKDKTSRLFLSGDNLSKRMIKVLSAAKVYSTNRKKEVNSFLPDNAEYDIAFVDTGGGAIHGDLEDFASNPNQVVYMHTGKKLTGFPKNHRLLKAGQRFIIHR